GNFPVEGLAENPPPNGARAPVYSTSWVQQILNYIEQLEAKNGTTIPILLCPTRGGRIGGMKDFFGAYSEAILNFIIYGTNTDGGKGALNGGIIDNALIVADHYQSIMDPWCAVNGRGATPAMMSAGQSNTLLLAHSILDPAHYATAGAGTNDLGWWNTAF